MEIIHPYFVIETTISSGFIYRTLERFGRTAYKSEDKITEKSAETFLRAVVARGHESVLEHVSITVRFICDRGVTHELVRHRLASYTQESTRFCNYQKKGVTFIKPIFWNEEHPLYGCWLSVMKHAEMAYNYLIENGATPQEARSVLPNSLKTEIVTTANIREWRHILRLRAAKNAHPQMRELMVKLLRELRLRLPVLFDDIPLADEDTN